MSNINDYVKPTDYGYVRKDINKILSLIHDLVAQEPESDGNKERIMFTPHVKLRTSSITIGGATWGLSEVRTKQSFVWRKVIPDSVNTYNLIHTTTGTLSFPVSDTKFGGRCDFDGTNFITITDDTLLDVTTGLTLSGFFYIPATTVLDTAEQTLIDKGVYGLYIDPHATTPNQIRGKVILSTVIYQVVGTITPNAWNHVTMTFDGSNIKLYIVLY